jgi:hypothetical protein
MTWILMSVMMALGITLAIVPLVVGITVQEKHFRRDDATATARAGELAGLPDTAGAPQYAVVGADAERATP